jgi:hypothetical protein
MPTCTDRWPMGARSVLAEGAIVAYDSPSWGPVHGRVLRVGGEHGPSDTSTALCQDLTPRIGAREWWPVSELHVLGGAR